MAIKRNDKDAEAKEHNNSKGFLLNSYLIRIFKYFLLELFSKLKTFTIVKLREQKKVFGLGYPSRPTYTVDEWFDTMTKSGGFNKGNVAKPFTIGGKNSHDRHSSGEEEDEIDEEEREKLRRTQMQLDEYHDWNRRGWGNTHNKG